MTAPTYIGTDRPVMLGDRGACTSVGIVHGTVVSMWLSAADVVWAEIRWPNNTTQKIEAASLHWVEPSITVEVELTDDLYERLCKHTVTQLSEAELQAVATAVARGIEQQ